MLWGNQSGEKDIYIISFGLNLGDEEHLFMAMWAMTYQPFASMEMPFVKPFPPLTTIHNQHIIGFKHITVVFHCFFQPYFTGWWFGTFFIFPYIGNNHPNWLIFFRGVQTTNQLRFAGAFPWNHQKPWGLLAIRSLRWPRRWRMDRRRWPDVWKSQWDIANYHPFKQQDTWKIYRYTQLYTRIYIYIYVYIYIICIYIYISLYIYIYIMYIYIYT